MSRIFICPNIISVFNFFFFKTRVNKLYVLNSTRFAKENLTLRILYHAVLSSLYSRARTNYVPGAKEYTQRSEGGREKAEHAFFPFHRSFRFDFRDELRNSSRPSIVRADFNPRESEKNIGAVSFLHTENGRVFIYKLYIFVIFRSSVYGRSCAT